VRIKFQTNKGRMREEKENREVVEKKGGAQYPPHLFPGSPTACGSGGWD